MRYNVVAFIVQYKFIKVSIVHAIELCLIHSLHILQCCFNYSSVFCNSINQLIDYFVLLQQINVSRYPKCHNTHTV